MPLSYIHHDCYFAIRNLLPVTLKRQSLKNDFGVWDSTPPDEIKPTGLEDWKIFSLKEKNGSGGTCGWVNYRATFAGMAIDFTFWMERCSKNSTSIYSDLKVERQDFPAKNLIQLNYYIRPESELPISGINYTYFEVKLLQTPEFARAFQSLILQEPLFPVIDEEGRCPTFRLTNQVLANSAGGCGAGTFALSFSTSTKILVKGSVDPTIAKMGVDLIAEWPGLPGKRLTNDANNITLDPKGNFEVKVDFVSSLVSNTVPWGYRGKVNWLVRIRETKQLLSIDNSEIEFYAVSPAAHSLLDILGIPVSLLRFAVLPTRSNGTIISDYPGWIVDRIHNDSGFAYERVSGANIFTGLTTFNLVGWLAAQKRNTKAAPWHLNCYDLAGITGICMSLSFKDAKEALCLQRHHMRPFGFIKPDHLIGWQGNTTSPIVSHKNDPASHIKDPSVERQVPVDSEMRHPFGSHVFLTWHGKVLDATVGPHKGTEYLPEYIEKSIDRHGDREIKEAGDLSSVTPMQTILGHYGFVAESEIILYPDSGYSVPLYHLEGIVKEITIKGIPNITFDDLLPVLIHRCKPSEIKGEFLPVTMSPSKQGDGTSLVWRMNVKTKGGIAGLLDLRITIFESRLKTQAACTALLSSMGVFTTKDNIVAIGGGQNCHLLKNKTSCHAIWIGGNHMLINLITTNLTVGDTMPIMKALNNILFDEMSNLSAKGGEKNLVCGKIKIEGPKDTKHPKDPKNEATVKCGTRITATVDVNNWVDWDWEEGWGNAIVLDYVKPKKDEKAWTFDIYTRRPGVESITFTFTDGTYNTQTTVLTMNIIE